MTVIVRAPTPEQRSGLEGFARVRDRALPYFLVTAESLGHDLARAHPDAHVRLFVAEEDGEITGTAHVLLAHDVAEPGQGFLYLYVDPGHTRRGAGSLLLRVAEEHLAVHGARRSYACVLDAPGNRAFAERHGYRPGRAAHFLRLDLAHGTLPPLQDPPPGAELRTGADFAADPRPLFELDTETLADEPSDVGGEHTDYATWLTETWHHPLVSHELTSVVLVDGRPAAFSAARTDGGTRYSTLMTGTGRAFRGRGLAKLAKNDSLHRARAAGCTAAFTGNDTGNDPMLAINKWFGYEICATEVRYVRELG